MNYKIPVLNYSFEDNNVKEALLKGNLWRKLCKYAGFPIYTISGDSVAEISSLSSSQGSNGSQVLELSPGTIYSIVDVEEVFPGNRSIMISDINLSNTNKTSGNTIILSIYEWMNHFLEFSIFFIRYSPRSFKSWYFYPHELTFKPEYSQRKNAISISTKLNFNETFDISFSPNSSISNLSANELFSNQIPSISTPMYSFRIREGMKKCKIFVSLNQKNSIFGNSYNIDIGLSLLKICEVKSQNNCQLDYELIGTTGFSIRNETTLEIRIRHEGDYIIVPTSTACMLLHRDAALQKTKSYVPKNYYGLHVNKRIENPGAHTSSFGIKYLAYDDENFSQIVSQVLDMVFDKYKSPMYDLVTINDMENFIRDVTDGKMGISVRVFDSLLSRFDSDMKRKGLTRKGFKQIQITKYLTDSKKFKKQIGYFIERDLKILKIDISKLYDEETPSYKFYINSQHDLQIVPIPYSSLIYSSSIKLIIFKYGEVKNYFGGIVRLHFLSPKINFTSGYSYLVVNNSLDRSVLIEMFPNNNSKLLGKIKFTIL